MGEKSEGGASEHPSKHARRLLPPFNPAPLLPRRAPHAAQDARFASGGLEQEGRIGVGRGGLFFAASEVVLYARP